MDKLRDRAALLLVLLLGASGATAQNLATTLPNGRRITPAGAWIKVAPYPYTLAIRPGGGQLVVPSIGWPFSLNIIDNPGAGAAGVSRAQRIPAGRKNDPEVQVHTGVVYSPDGKWLYDTSGDTGEVHILSTETWKRVATVALNGPTGGRSFAESFAASLALSPDGRWLYVLDQGNWRVVVIDTRSRRRVTSLATGSNPFSLALAPDGSRLYITNSGLFEYQQIGGVAKNDILKTGITFPAFGYPSRAAREGGKVEGHDVPGLGNENDARGSSLWTYDVTDAVSSRLLGKLRLGQAIEPGSAVGGASPSGVVASRDHVYVALAHEDAVAVVNTNGTSLEQEISLSPFTGKAFFDRQGRPLRGVMPAGLAIQGRRLYVTEAGLNAVAVIDTAANRVLGHLPVGWYPTAAAVSDDGRLLYVVNTKGKGSGPNGGDAFHPENTGSYVGELEFGSVSVIPLGDEGALRQATAATVSNNEAALLPDATLPTLRHIFLIIRENRTYDEILGDLPGGDGDQKLARWGLHGWLSTAPLDKTIQVTPNAHALAQRFATSDRFFVDSDVSADGHRWAMGAAPTPWFHIAWTSNYGGRRTGDPFSAAPGRRAIGGGADAPMPEDEPEFGTLWEHIAAAGLTIRNYGEGLEVEGGDESDGSAPSGQRLVLNAPVPQPVFTSSDRDFPTFNLGIPDQFRYQEFAKDFTRVLHGSNLPALIVIRLPCDHTASPRARDGYPDRASYVADNDLALGKIIDLLSHSAIWKDSAVFVTEDDAQGGVDHVDAHRSVLLAMSPYIRKGIISHRRSSMTSIQKTIYELLGVGPLNLEDSLAADLSDLFIKTPDLASYSALPADPRVFDPAKARLARPKNAQQARELLDCDDPKEIEAEFRREARKAAAHPAGQ